jgi:hypothetical protein
MILEESKFAGTGFGNTDYARCGEVGESRFVSPGIYAVNAGPAIQKMLHDVHKPKRSLDIVMFFGIPVLWFAEAELHASDIEVTKSATTAMSRADEPFMSMGEQRNFGQRWQVA